MAEAQGRRPVAREADGLAGHEVPSDEVATVGRVPSRALQTWRGPSAARLDELLAAHAAVGGKGRGRRWATEQLNMALVLQVAALFQLFCRDLYSEAVEALTDDLPEDHRPSFRAAATADRPLGRGNATASAIGAAFGRLAIQIWPLADAQTPRTATRRERLEQLNTWRNAIAHQDFQLSDELRRRITGTTCTLVWVRRWRTACDGLVATFDEVVGARIAQITGAPPWLSYDRGMARTAKKSPVVVGAEVGVRFGTIVIRARVEEDRGEFRGRHLVVVRLLRDDDSEQYVEMPFNELEPPPA